MIDFSHVISSLRRPRLLVRAARYSVGEYRRQKSLRRLFPGEKLNDQSQILPRLLETEAALEVERKSGAAAYSPARHIELLAALMVEARATDENRLFS